MKKVYLGKSNLTSYKRAEQVRLALMLDPEHELLENNDGSSYTSQLLLESDVLFLVTSTDIHDDNDEVLVGRGQYEQAILFRNTYPNRPIFVVTNVDMNDTDIDYALVTDIERWNNDWKLSYGKFTIESLRGMIFDAAGWKGIKHPDFTTGQKKGPPAKKKKKPITTNPCCEIELKNEEPEELFKQLPKAKYYTDENGHTVCDVSEKFDELERRVRNKLNPIRKLRLGCARKLGVI